LIERKSNVTNGRCKCTHVRFRDGQRTHEVAAERCFCHNSHALEINCHKPLVRRLCTVHCEAAWRRRAAGAALAAAEQQVRTGARGGNGSGVRNYISGWGGKEMRVADSDEMIQHAVRIDDAAPYTKAFIVSEVEYGAGVAIERVHFDELRGTVAIARGDAVARRPAFCNHTAHLSLVTADQHFRHIF
jgi:hypothetical protein